MIYLQIWLGEMNGGGWEGGGKGWPFTHPSWSAVAPSAGSGWHGLDSLRPYALSCGWTADLPSRQPHRHPPGRSPGLCARSLRCCDERRRKKSDIKPLIYTPQMKLRRTEPGTMFHGESVDAGEGGCKDTDICLPCIRGKVVLHSFLVHREQAGVLVCPGKGSAALLVFSGWEKKAKEKLGHTYVITYGQIRLKTEYLQER